MVEDRLCNAEALTRPTHHTHVEGLVRQDASSSPGPRFLYCKVNGIEASINLER